jgi:hypothetical protein
MARLKLKQILSNLHYDADKDQLILSGSKALTQLNWEDANLNWEDVDQNWNEFAFGSGSRVNTPDFVIYGSTFVTSSVYTTGSITINGVDTFGDSGSFDTVDLGNY